MENSKSRPMERQLRTIEKRLVDVLTSAGYLKGRSRKFSEITAYIYIRQEVNQETLRRLTGSSLGTISTALQFLEKQGVLRKHSDPDTHEYHYELDGTMSQVLFRSLAELQRGLSQLKVFLRGIDEKLGQSDLSTKKGYESIRQLLDEMNVLIPAYERVFQRFQTFATIAKPQLGETNDI